MKIRDIQVTIIGEGKNVNPDKGLIEPLAVIQVLSDEGLTGWSESFRVPPGVAKAVLHGPDSFFGRHLIGETLTHPERLWQKLYDAMLHYNRRGWSVDVPLGFMSIQAREPLPTWAAVERTRLLFQFVRP